MDREIPQLLHIGEVFGGLGKEEFLSIVFVYGLFSALFDKGIFGVGLGIAVAVLLHRWKEEKPRGVIYFKIRRIFPVEKGLLNTGIDPIDRRIVA